jgi:hypothetical protein
MAVADALDTQIDLVGNPNQRLRRLAAFTRRYYSAVAIPSVTLREAGLAAGLDL